MATLVTDSGPGFDRTPAEIGIGVDTQPFENAIVTSDGSVFLELSIEEGNATVISDTGFTSEFDGLYEGSFANAAAAQAALRAFTLEPENSSPFGSLDVSLSFASGPTGGIFWSDEIPSSELFVFGNASATQTLALGGNAFGPFLSVFVLDDVTERITVNLTVDGFSLPSGIATSFVSTSADAVNSYLESIDLVTATKAGTDTISATFTDAHGAVVATKTFTGIVPGTVTVSDTVDPTTAMLTPGSTGTPFANITISDTAASETISAVLATTGFTLPSGQATTITGKASDVQATLRALTVTAQAGSDTISAAIKDSQGNTVATQTLTASAAAPVVTVTDTDPITLNIHPNDVITPFAHLSISDTVPTETLSVTLDGTTTPGHPIFVDPTNGKPREFHPFTNDTAANLQTELNGLTLAASTTGSTTLTLSILNFPGLVTQAQEKITVNVVGFVTLADTTDAPFAAVTSGSVVKPFAHATVSDTAPTDTISAQIGLSSGYTTSSKLSFVGTAAQVQTFLDGFSANATKNGPGAITATVTDATGANSSITFTGTGPGAGGLQSPTAAQIAKLTTDTIQFYTDSGNNAADSLKLTNDFLGLKIDKPTLAQLLTAALQHDVGSPNAGTLGGDLANLFFGTINGDLSAGSGNLRADLTAMMTKTVAVGSSYVGFLAKPETATQALADTVKQYHLA